jgi:hypothetical protein
MATDGGWTNAICVIMIDSAPFSYGMNKCQTGTSDRLNKCVHSNVLLCSICEMYTEQRAFADSINVLFSIEEN